MSKGSSVGQETTARGHGYPDEELRRIAASCLVAHSEEMAFLRSEFIQLGLPLPPLLAGAAPSGHSKGGKVGGGPVFMR